MEALKVTMESHWGTTAVGWLTIIHDYYSDYYDYYSDKSVESVNVIAVRELEDLLRRYCRFLEKRS